MAEALSPIIDDIILLIPDPTVRHRFREVFLASIKAMAGLDELDLRAYEADDGGGHAQSGPLLADHIGQGKVNWDEEHTGILAENALPGHAVGDHVTE